MTAFAHVTGQRLGVSELPEFAQGVIGELVELTQGVGEIEALAANGRGDDKSVKLSVSCARELARVMQSDAGGGVHIDAIYWRVSKVALDGVVDQIRTRLTELMAELRSLTPGTQGMPNAQQATAAYDIVIRGINAKVVINTISGGDGSVNRIEPADPEVHSSFWTASRRIAAIVVGVATVIAAVVAVLQFH